MSRLLTACVILCLAGLALLPLAAAAADTPAEEVAEIMAGVEGLVTQLAMSEELSGAEVEALRVSLATLYGQLETLSGMLEELPVGPPLDLTEWRPYPGAVSVITPEDAEFTGWNIDSGIDLGWGDYGEVVLDIENSAYRANWTIPNAYEGEVKASVQAGPDGNVLLTITDSKGEREFRIENGGIGPIMTRTPEAEDAADADSQDSADAMTAEPLDEPEPESQPAAADPEWAAEYRTAVAAGQLESAPTMDWFINQTRTRSYESDALRDLGDAVLGLSGQPKWNEPLGIMAYYVNDQRKEMHIPDPRTYPEGFSHVINKMYILTLSDQVCVVEIAP